MQMIAANAERMAADTLQVIAQDNEHNTTNNSIIQQSVERDENSVPASAAEQQPSIETRPTENTVIAVPAPATISMPVAAPVNKPVVVTKKPVLGKPVNITNNAKPKVETKKQKVETKKPKLVMPKPAAKKPAAAKPANEY